MAKKAKFEAVNLCGGKKKYQYRQKAAKKMKG